MQSSLESFQTETTKLHHEWAAFQNEDRPQGVMITWPQQKACVLWLNSPVSCPAEWKPHGVLIDFGSCEVLWSLCWSSKPSGPQASGPGHTGTVTYHQCHRITQDTGQLYRWHTETVLCNDLYFLCASNSMKTYQPCTQSGQQEQKVVDLIKIRVTSQYLCLLWAFIK